MEPSCRHFSSPPPTTRCALLSFPAPKVLLVTLNRPDTMNSLLRADHAELDAVWEWMDTEPALLVGVITGNEKAFSTGANLKEWQTLPFEVKGKVPGTGFLGLSRRHASTSRNKKPIIAAVSGLCVGAAFEAAMNCDMIIASLSAAFILPETKIGQAALAGAIPALVLALGRQRASELLYTGRRLGAEEARSWGIVNKVAEDVVAAAVEMAKNVAEGSPESVIVTRKGMDMVYEGFSVEEFNQKLENLFEIKVKETRRENFEEGIRAFVEKRNARWVVGKL